MTKNEESDELILVEKDGEQIRIHPLALEDHKRLGWKVVEAEVPAEAESEKESKGKAAKSKAAKE